LFSQEDNIKEITEMIVEFVSSLPKTIKKLINEPSEELEEKSLEENGGNSHQYHNDHRQRYPFGQNLGMYGLGPGWMG
jgi:transposase